MAASSNQGSRPDEAEMPRRPFQSAAALCHAYLGSKQSWDHALALQDREQNLVSWCCQRCVGRAARPTRTDGTDGRVGSGAREYMVPPMSHMCYSLWYVFGYPPTKTDVADRRNMAHWRWLSRGRHARLIRHLVPASFRKRSKDRRLTI